MPKKRSLCYRSYPVQTPDFRSAKVEVPRRLSPVMLLSPARKSATIANLLILKQVLVYSYESVQSHVQFPVICPHEPPCGGIDSLSPTLTFSLSHATSSLCTVTPFLYG